MAKRKAKRVARKPARKSSAKKSVASRDISNWMVVVMLVAVILVSTFSIIMFMDAVDSAQPEFESATQGEVSLNIVDTPAEPSTIDQSDDASGEVSLGVE